MKKGFFCVLLCILYVCAQAQSLQSVYKTQLEQLKKSEMLKELHLGLKDYANKGAIETDEDLKNLKAQLLSESDSYFPISDSPDELAFLNLQEIREQKGEAETKVMVDRLAETIDKLVICRSWN